MLNYFKHPHPTLSLPLATGLSCPFLRKEIKGRNREGVHDFSRDHAVILTIKTVRTQEIQEDNALRCDRHWRGTRWLHSLACDCPNGGQRSPG